MQRGNITPLNIRTPQARSMGVDQVSQRNGLSSVELVKQAGDIVYLGINDILDVSPIDSPLHFQAVGGDVKVSYTLVNPSRALNRRKEIQDSVPWVNEVTITPGTIVQSELLNFSALKLEFVTGAEFYIHAR